MGNPTQRNVTSRRFAGKTLVRWKLATFATSTALLMPAQYFASTWGGVWDLGLVLLLAHSVVMLTDAVCELYEERAPRWKNAFTGFLLPVEPRGISNVLMMIGLFAAIALAIQIRGCSESREQKPQTPATEGVSAETG